MGKKNLDQVQKRLDDMFDFGLQVLDEYKRVFLHKIHFNKTYQRQLRQARLKPIKESIKKYGYWPSEIIIINQDWQIIDGQHRWEAAKKCNIKKVPICRVTFPTKELEAAFFYHKNNYNTKLVPVDYWDARNLAGDVTARMIYLLESSSESLFCNKITIKGKSSKHSKFNINDVLSVLQIMIRNSVAPWNMDNDQLIRQAIYDVGEREAMMRCNVFLTWFFGCFGDDKKENPIPYRRDSIRAICAFYQALKEQQFLNNAIKPIVNKMKSFSLNQDFVLAPQLTKTHMLVNHFNSGKKTKRLVYVV